MSIIVSDPKESTLLSLMIQKKDYNGNSSYLRVYEHLKGSKYSFPIQAAIQRGFKPKMRPEFGARSFWNFRGNFNSEEQKKAFDETLSNLSSQNACILAVPVGFGKTFLALKIAAHIGLKTLVVMPTSKKVLQSQWEEEIKTFLPDSKVQLLESKTKIDRSANIFIIGSHTILKIYEYLTFIPFVIVDELHLVLSPKGYTSLLHLFPFYILGLSATPYRLDGSNGLIEMFFGRAQVYRRLYRDYEVCVIFTPFSYTMEKTESGQLNWGSILNQQAQNEERNKMIAQIICTNRQVKFLILCKRVNQIKDISQKCRERGVAIQAVYEDISPVKDERSLVGSILKLGTGFSDSSFKGLIIAADVQDYFIQYFGRVLRRPDDCPTIYDIVDNNHVMLKHYKERKEIYRTSGGKLKTKKVGLV